MYIHIPHIAESPIAASCSFTACFNLNSDRSHKTGRKEWVVHLSTDSFYQKPSVSLWHFCWASCPPCYISPGQRTIELRALPCLATYSQAEFSFPLWLFYAIVLTKSSWASTRPWELHVLLLWLCFQSVWNWAPGWAGMRFGHTEDVWSRGQGCNLQILMVGRSPSETCLPGDDMHMDPGLEGPAQGWGGGHGVHQKGSWPGGWEGAPLAWVLMTKSTHPKLTLRCCFITIQQPATPGIRISAGQPKIRCPPIFWVQAQQGSVISFALRWRWDTHRLCLRGRLCLHAVPAH